TRVVGVGVLVRGVACVGVASGVADVVIGIGRARVRIVLQRVGATTAATAATAIATTASTRVHPAVAATSVVIASGGKDQVVAIKRLKAARASYKGFSAHRSSSCRGRSARTMPRATERERVTFTYKQRRTTRSADRVPLDLTFDAA